MKDYDAQAFPPFAVTVDIVLLSAMERFSALLVERGEEPFAGQLALPGGFVKSDEAVDAAAVRELAEETGVRADGSAIGHLEQLATFGEPGRDPRMRVVSVAYVALVPGRPVATAGSDAAAATWLPVEEVTGDRLAFDHAQILAAGIERVRSKLEYTTIATSLADPVFTMSELRGIYERVWGAALEPANFRRKVLASPGFVRPTGKRRTAEGGGPPAALYRAGTGALLSPPLLRP